MDTQDKIKNLEILIAAVEAQPEALFDLGKYQQQTECGTLFCTVGLATTLPHFQQLGFHISVEDTGYGRLFTSVKVGDVNIFDYGTARQYFGESFDNLFSPAGCGDIDEALGYDVDEDDFGDDVPTMTDKELALSRLYYALENLKG